MDPKEQVTIVLVPIGALGLGIDEGDVERGIAAGPHAIACDAGSTDSGPAYLRSEERRVGKECA